MFHQPICGTWIPLYQFKRSRYVINNIRSCYQTCYQMTYDWSDKSKTLSWCHWKKRLQSKEIYSKCQVQQFDLELKPSSSKYHLTLLTHVLHWVQVFNIVPSKTTNVLTHNSLAFSRLQTDAVQRQCIYHFLIDQTKFWTI